MLKKLATTLDFQLLFKVAPAITRSPVASQRLNDVNHTDPDLKREKGKTYTVEFRALSMKSVVTSFIPEFEF